MQTLTRSCLLIRSGFSQSVCNLTSTVAAKHRLIYNDLHRYEGRQMSPLQILYRSEHYVVVNKPFDIKINSDNPEEVTLETLLLQRGVKCAGEGRKPLVHSFYWVHRLDYATSGVLCIGLTKKAARLATHAFENKRVKKCYLALVRGDLCIEGVAESHPDVTLVKDPQPHLLITAGLVRDWSTDFPYIFRAQHSHNGSPKTDPIVPASTSVYVLETGTYMGDKATKALLVPHTGRSHQLRVHCSYIGHTIVGDYTYSKRADTKPLRMMLHSYSINIPLAEDISSSGEDINVTSDDPFLCDSQWQTCTVTAQLSSLLHTLT